MRRLQKHEPQVPARRFRVPRERRVGGAAQREEQLSAHEAWTNAHALDDTIRVQKHGDLEHGRDEDEQAQEPVWKSPPFTRAIVLGITYQFGVAGHSVATKSNK